MNAADIDNDNQMESIIAVKGTIEPCDSNGDCGGVEKFKYVDSQNGEIDNDYTRIEPWETNKAGADINATQGLIHNYTVKKTDNNKLQKDETPTTITTATSTNGQQEITHTIRLNNGQENHYTTTFKAVSPQPQPWSVNK